MVVFKSVFFKFQLTVTINSAVERAFWQNNEVITALDKEDVFDDTRDKRLYFIDILKMRVDGIDHRLNDFCDSAGEIFAIDKHLDRLKIVRVRQRGNIDLHHAFKFREQLEDVFIILDVCRGRTRNRVHRHLVGNN